MLQRSIGKWAMVLLIINGVIGAGIFGLPAKVFSQVGLYSLLVFGVCTLAALVVIICFAEVASRFQKTGGPYVYAKASFGGLTAFVTGWLLLLTRFITYAALVNLLVTYLVGFSPWFALPNARVIVIIGVTAVLALFNYRGVQDSTRINNLFTLAKMLALLSFIIVGIFYIDIDNFKHTVTPDFTSFSSTALLLMFAFGGFESVLVNSGEVKNPSKVLPFALITGALIIAVFYILIQVVSIGTLPQLANSTTPLADAAAQFMGKPGLIFITIGALVSILGTLNAIMLAGSRLPFALSVEKQFPAIFSRVHPKFKTPSLSLLLFTVITIIISLNYSFISAASISAITRIMIYVIVCAALLKLRKTPTAPEAGYTVKYGKLAGVTGIIISLWLLHSATLLQLRDIGVATAVGLIIFGLVQLSNKQQRGNR